MALHDGRLVVSSTDSKNEDRLWVYKYDSLTDAFIPDGDFVPRLVVFSLGVGHTEKMNTICSHFYPFYVWDIIRKCLPVKKIGFNKTFLKA